MMSLTSEERFLEAYGIRKLNDSRIVRAMISVLGMTKSREIITEYTALEDWEEVVKEKKSNRVKSCEKQNAEAKSREQKRLYQEKSRW